MNFVINNDEWEIKEISNADMNILENSDGRNFFVHGTTRYNCNTIFINEDAPNKRKTLIHELTHCLMYEYAHNQFEDKSFTHEDICEISASFHDIISEIVEEYFKGVRK